MDVTNTVTENEPDENQVNGLISSAEAYVNLRASGVSEEKALVEALKRGRSRG